MRKARRPDAPLDATLLKKARELVERYRLLIESSPRIGYIGRTLELSGCMADGRTIEQCAANVREATAGLVAYMLEIGERPPAPASEGLRQAQINIRVTDEERTRFETAAQRQGFRNVSEFLRTAGLRAADAA